MQLLGSEVIHPLSPQAKGRVDRPSGGMQDRIVRACALEGIDSIVDGRAVLHEELDRYNNHQVHSATGEIPSLHFARAVREGKRLFRPFALPSPSTSVQD